MINAIKFTSVGGKIELRSYKIGAYVKISVRDNGVGMDPCEAERLFLSLNTTHKKGTNLEKGTGLGLMLCKDFIEKNKGTLSVASEPGRGSIFSFTLQAYSGQVLDAVMNDLVQVSDKN
jgi:signal transduction histidine kinase